MIFKLEDFGFVDGNPDFDNISCIKAAEIANAKLQEWLDSAPTIYATKVFTSAKDESLRWTAPTEPLHGVCFATRKAKLVCIESIKKPHHNDEHETT